MAKNVYLLIKKERYSNSFLMEKVVFFLSTNACHIKKARVLSKLRGDIALEVNYFVLSALMKLRKKEVI